MVTKLAEEVLFNNLVEEVQKESNDNLDGFDIDKWKNTLKNNDDRYSMNAFARLQAVTDMGEFRVMFLKQYSRENFQIKL